MTTTYFAYGSNMDPDQMARRCPGASAIGVGRLDDHALRFTYDSPTWVGGVATVVPAAGDEVWGVLWALTDEHVAILDEYESVPTVYRRDHQAVVRDGASLEAMLYVTNEVTEVAPNRTYIEGLLRGARAFDLPPRYVERLASVPTA